MITIATLLLLFNVFSNSFTENVLVLIKISKKKKND